MSNNTYAHIFRFFRSTGFSIFFLLVVFAVLGAMAYYVTQSYQVEPDFGGILTIRQADMGIDYTGTEAQRLSRVMILSYITDEKVLVPIAKKNGWDRSYQQLVESIDVKEPMSAQNSYTVIANTGLAERSKQVARELAMSFLENYHQQWKQESKKILQGNADKIKAFTKELSDLKKLKGRFQERKELRPLNTEVEMQALNDQLVEAQNQFLTAYGAYITRMEVKRTEMQLQLDLALQVRTEDDIEIKNMRKQLVELDRQCVVTQKQLADQKPDLYRMTMDPPKLTGLPTDILYLYDNIQTLQQIKLALMLDTIIEDKEKMVEREQKMEKTIEKLLSSNSCDVFIREVGE